MSNNVTYYNKSREPISLEEYIQLKQNSEYTLIKEDTLPDGKWIWTGWIGLDPYRYDNPRVFETLVFESEHQQEVLYTRRYATLDAAILGHAIAILDALEKEEGLNPRE